MLMKKFLLTSDLDQKDYRSWAVLSEGRIADENIPGKLFDDEPDFGWNTSNIGESEFYDIPSQFTFLVKAADVFFDFDLYSLRVGFLISDRFNEFLLSKEVNNYVKSKCSIVSTKGDLLSNNNIYYIRFKYGKNLLDLNLLDINGQYHEIIDSSNLLDSHGVLKCSNNIYLLDFSEKVVLISDIPKNWAPIFCNEEFTRDCESMNFNGCSFVDSADLMVVDFFPHNSDQFREISPTMIKKDQVNKWNLPPDRQNFWKPNQNILARLRKKGLVKR